MNQPKFLILTIIFLFFLGLVLFLIYAPGRLIEVNPHTKREQAAPSGQSDEVSSRYGVGVKNNPTLSPKQVSLLDIEPQSQLSNPPKVVRAIYLTGWSAGNEAKIREVINLSRAGKINAVVIDIKDFSGKVSYDTSVKEAAGYRAEERRIPRINALIKRLHDENIYVIARLTVFQDPVLAQARPELAVKSIELSESATASDDLWRDFKGLAWIDPAATASWDYFTALARDAWDRGFDEINFDYIRFPTDGDLADRKFPVWDGKRLMSSVMNDFYGEVRRDLPEGRLSIDLFGLAATSFYDFGVGQLIEDAYQYFDFVSPMLYPSHFPLSFLGPPVQSSISEEGEYKKPAEHPYEVVRKSMDTAFARLKQSGSDASLRPWLQDFDLGADYDAEKVMVQIQATIDALGGKESKHYRGFILWNASNIYTEEAL